MVRGLTLFKEHFVDYAEQYSLIGGTACSIIMESLGRDFRATQDLDIVLCAETLSSDFTKAFWEFIQAGGYEFKYRSEGEPQLYRFIKPKNDTYPKMLELFSRQLSSVLFEDADFTSISPDDEGYSLSAILLNDEYYSLIQEGTVLIDDIPIVKAEYLIPLKIRAFLDLKHKKERGEDISSKVVKKHKNDVMRLSVVVPGNVSIQLSDEMKADLHSYIEDVEATNPDLKSLGVETDLQQIIAVLRKVYT